MEINITNKNGIVLKTANTYVEEDISVTIDGGLLPSGSMDITENGTYDVASVENAVVNVPVPDGYIQPSGSLEITENNTYDVTEKASVVVNVPTAEVLPLYSGAYEVNKSSYTVTLELDTNVGNTVDYLTDNGLSGTITEDNSPLILEGVTSITIPNGMIAAMSHVYIDEEYQSDINTYETFTIPITKNCVVRLVSAEG